MSNTPYPLNAGQQAAADAFFEFLLDDTRKEMILSGAGGVGKTYLMGYMVDRVIPQYEETCQLIGLPIKYHDVHMTATTNKAAEVLTRATGREVSTIQSFLALKVTDDYKTGTSKLSRTAKWMVHKNIIVFIDEAPMVDSVLLNFIREGLHDCKIVYVGDREQLAPVTEQLSRIYSDNLPTFELTEPMRNAGQPALLALCSQIRESVKTKEFFPITPVPGVVDIILDENQMIQELEQAFLKPDHNNRVLAYTNKCVVSYNDFIRSSRNLPPQYTLGERLVLGSALQLKDCILPVEEEFSIDYMSPEVDIVELPDGGELEVRNVTLRSIYNDLHSARMPVNREHYFDLIKYYQKQKAWPTYFMLKNKFPDLRPLEASTVHKAQGSTYDTVFIDATNLSSCHLVDQAARLLYVAVTRARHRVVFYGNLAEKYGGYNLE